MSRAIVWTLAVGTALALSACGEKGRTVGADAAPYVGPANSASPFVAPGWKPGDKSSWEQSLKVRNQYGQNDHAR